MEFNSHYKDVKDKFIRTSVDLSVIMSCCEKIVDDISQDKIDELAAAVESFDKEYAKLKAAVNKFVVESFKDKTEIEIFETKDGFRL